jgi:hypothetical protein
LQALSSWRCWRSWSSFSREARRRGQRRRLHHRSHHTDGGLHAAHTIDKLKFEIPAKTMQLIFFCLDGSCPESYEAAKAALGAGYTMACGTAAA